MTPKTKEEILAEQKYPVPTHMHITATAYEFTLKERSAYIEGLKDASQEVKDAIPYQTCPKCIGQGVLGFPPYAVAGSTPLTSASSFPCDVCNGAKIISQYRPKNSDQGVKELVEALGNLVKSWDDRCSEKEKFLHNDEHDFDYWSPVASLVESQYISAARKALANYKNPPEQNQPK